jgi:regulator of protease activity HflC (stomatin/prohibitin superfamily)
MGIDALIDWLKDVWDQITPYYEVKEWEKGIVLRFGRYLKDVKAGAHFRIPIFDSIYTEEVNERTSRLPFQSLMTKDGKTVSLSVVVRWKIHNVRSFICKVAEGEESFEDITLGAMSDFIQGSTLSDFKDVSIADQIQEQVKDSTPQWGVTIISVRIVDFTTARPLRLLQE